MTPSNKGEKEAAEAAAEVARRAVRRLDVLEWLIYAGALAVAVLGGAGVAWLLEEPESPGFRRTWAVSSVLLFVVPGAVVLIQSWRAERSAQRERDTNRNQRDG